MRITSALLEKHDACRDSVAEFRKLFPGGVGMTKRDILAAAKLSELANDADWLIGALWGAEAEYFWEQHASALDVEYASSRALYIDSPEAAVSGRVQRDFPEVFCRHSAIALWETYKKFGRGRGGKKQ